MRAGAATGSGARCALPPPLPPPASQSVMAPALPLPRLRDLPHPDLLPPKSEEGADSERPHQPPAQRRAPPIVEAAL